MCTPREKCQYRRSFSAGNINETLRYSKTPSKVLIVSRLGPYKDCLRVARVGHVRVTQHADTAPARASAAFTYVPLVVHVLRREIAQRVRSEPDRTSQRPRHLDDRVGLGLVEDRQLLGSEVGVGAQRRG